VAPSGGCFTAEVLDANTWRLRNSWVMMRPRWLDLLAEPGGHGGPLGAVWIRAEGNFQAPWLTGFQRHPRYASAISSVTDQVRTFRQSPATAGPSSCTAPKTAVRLLIQRLARGWLELTGVMSPSYSLRNPPLGCL